MDRDLRWKRVQKGYDALVKPGKKGVPRIKNIRKYITECHKKDIGDEFIPPAALEGYEGIKNNDSLVFFNYRQDRAIQITKALIEPEFTEFPVKNLNIKFLGMTRYYDTFTEYIIPPFKIKNTLGEVLSKNNRRQLRITETEKFKHLTSFLNGKVEKPFPGEDRVLIPSPKVATYDLKPEMRVREITDEVEKQLLSKKYDVIFINYAAPDMVGHSGKIPAAIKAVEAVDDAVGRVTRLVLEAGGACLVTSDHGDCEDMLGEKKTSHTTNPVQCILISRFTDVGLKNGGTLSNLAPTILQLIGLKQPKDMTGESLLRKI